MSDKSSDSEDLMASATEKSVPGVSQDVKPLEKPQKSELKPSEGDVEEFDTDEEEESNPPASKSGVDPSSSDYSQYLTYEGDLCIYTEPGTGRKLIWDKEKNSWVPREAEGAENPMQNYEFDGKNYVYTDKTSNVTYKFDQDKKEWVAKEKEGAGPETATPGGVYGFEDDTHTYTDPSDGSVYMWDREKNAWFPKIDDDFMARYQMSYGFTDPNAHPPSLPVAKPDEKSKKEAEKELKKIEAKRKAAEPPTWFEVDEAHNTAIYISGLPLDITMDELIELVGKCGLVARDDKNKDKIKMYRDAEGNPKGDALCTYIKVESVDLALKVLDGSQMRGKTISIQRAKFQMKGQYDPTLKPKRKKKDKDRQKKIQDKLFDWRPDRLPGEPMKCERVVIIKNLFTPEDFDKDVALLLEYQQDIRSECSKCGDVRKVTVYDRHPEGVAQITFREPSEAQACVQLLNGRWFGQRKITADIWDGKTKYKIAETDAEIEARLDKWDKFLEQEDERKEAAAKAQT
ncbi:17S U2 SnRNP complex component HTATSF1 [Diachasmimorpha longicaudata]|uniref:17S U2 SnRNP complex component HTATSF1 n=1 Tax=Diachasmimorpha longicaudata TaxID=58733 RepID=UPI0030B883E7